MGFYEQGNGRAGALQSKMFLVLAEFSWRKSGNSDSRTPATGCTTATRCANSFISTPPKLLVVSGKKRKE